MNNDTRVPPGATPRSTETRLAGLLYVKGLPSDPAVVARVAQTDAGFRIPVHRYAGAGALAAVVALNGQAVPASFLKLRQPRLVVLADDLPSATGPDAWPQARKLLLWAHSAVFHAAAGRAADYEMISAATVKCGRMLLVEMEYRHMQAWMRLAARVLPRLNVLQIVPAEGQHPIQGAPVGTVIQ